MYVDTYNPILRARAKTWFGIRQKEDSRLATIFHFHARLCRRLNEKYYVHTYQEKLSGLELLINTCGKVPLQDCFLDDEILVWSL
jgi:hypothetical protein